MCVLGEGVMMWLFYGAMSCRGGRGSNRWVAVGVEYTACPEFQLFKKHPVHRELLVHVRAVCWANSRVVC